MAKYLVVIAFLITVNLWGQDASQNQQASASATKGQSEQANKPIPDPTPVINPSVPASQSQPAPAEKKQESPDNTLWWGFRPEWVIVWVTIAYTMLTGFTLRAIKRQADLMERQINEGTSAAKEATAIAKAAADAALLNAQAVINAERAWLLFTVRKHEIHEYFVVKAVNYGRVPARYIEIGKQINEKTSLQDLVSSPPDYGADISDVQEYLAPQESWFVAAIFPQRTSLERFYDKTHPAPLTDSITYGQITYFDGISSERRHSRYCIALDVDDKYEPISVVGNGEYLECT